MADKTLVTNNRVVKIPIMAEPVALALTVLSALVIYIFFMPLRNFFDVSCLFMFCRLLLCPVNIQPVNVDLLDSTKQICCVLHVFILLNMTWKS